MLALFLPFVLEPVLRVLSIVMTLLSISRFFSINPLIKFLLSSHLSTPSVFSLNPLNPRLFCLNRSSRSETLDADVSVLSVQYLVLLDFLPSSTLNLSLPLQTICFKNLHLCLQAFDFLFRQSVFITIPFSFIL